MKGSVTGAAAVVTVIAGTLLVGLMRSATVRYWSSKAELFAIFAVMAVVLVVRPKGLFAAQEARKI